MLLKAGFELARNPIFSSLAFVVIPAKAGIQVFQAFLDARLRHAGMTNYTTSIL